MRSAPIYIVDCLATVLIVIADLIKQPSLGANNKPIDAQAKLIRHV